MSLLDDLSGVELRMRLEQRGYPPAIVEWANGHRDCCAECRVRILSLIDRDYDY